MSDGQRRRVQICVGLLRPFKVLLLDEITVDLDVLGRWQGHMGSTAGSTACNDTHHSSCLLLQLEARPARHQVA